MSGRHTFIRNRAADTHLETFFVAAVSAVLGIRFFLHITGYPQVGGDVLHIAHMLWGGLLMLAAVVMMMSFLDHAAFRVAVILAGLGFGTFIDEVGKFITNDNNYFFEPAVAVMYGVFIATYLIAQAIHTRSAYSPEENLVNALQGLKEVALQDLDEEEKRQTLAFLKSSDPKSPLVGPLQELIAGARLVDPSPPDAFSRLRHRIRRTYRRVINVPGFPKLLVGFFLAQLALRLAHVFGLIFMVGLGHEDLFNHRLLGILESRMQNLGVIDVVEILSSLLSAVFVFWGVVRIRRSRLAAYRMFQRSVLVTIFLTQVFIFYREQFTGLVGLLFNILILVVLDYMINRERLDYADGGHVGKSSGLV